MDAFYLLSLIAFFAVSARLVHAFERLRART